MGQLFLLLITIAWAYYMGKTIYFIFRKTADSKIFPQGIRTSLFGRKVKKGVEQ